MRNVVLAGAKSRQAKSVHAPPGVEADGRRWSGVRRSGGGGGDGKCEISLVPFFPSVDAGEAGKRESGATKRGDGRNGDILEHACPESAAATARVGVVF